MAAKDKRFTLTVKLQCGADDDLIDWWKALPKGDHSNSTGSRNTYAKKVLRFAVDQQGQIAKLEAALAEGRRNEAQLAEQLSLEQHVRAALDGELQTAQQRAVDLQADVDLLRQQASQAYDDQQAQIDQMKTILSKLPVIARKSVEAVVQPQHDDGRLDAIQDQLAALVARIEEVAAMRGGTAKPVKKRTLTEDEIAEREQQLMKASW